MTETSGKSAKVAKADRSAKVAKLDRSGATRAAIAAAAAAADLEDDHAHHAAPTDADQLDEPLHPPYDAPYDETDDHDDVVELTTPKRGRARGRKRGRILAASVALIAGGAAIAILSTLVSPSHPSRVDAAGDHAVPPPPKAPPVPAAPVHADPAAIYARARTTLTELFASPSDRVRRVAALALSRVGDQAALDYLAHALETETSAINRMQDAFAMARASDKRGHDALVAGLASPRRDVRSEAATGLLRLGDKAGAPFMSDLMQLDQNKISAAQVLAQIGDAKAIALLRALVADPKAPREQHMRALIALAYADQGDVAVELRTHLTAAGDDQRVSAARALAHLGDAAAAADATDVLAPELDVESLRVEAAIALRRLYARPEAHLDPAVWADHLAPALTGGRDTDQVTAAEAALILFGPSTVAEHE